MASDITLSDEQIIVQPNRLSLLETAILKGEPIDPLLGKRLALLQAIDVVNIGAEFAEQAARRQQEADRDIFSIIRSTIG